MECTYYINTSRYTHLEFIKLAWRLGDNGQLKASSIMSNSVGAFICQVWKSFNSGIHGEEEDPTRRFFTTVDSKITTYEGKFSKKREFCKSYCLQKTKPRRTWPQTSLTHFCFLLFKYVFIIEKWVLIKKNYCKMSGFLF